MLIQVYSLTRLPAQSERRRRAAETLRQVLKAYWISNGLRRMRREQGRAAANMHLDNLGIVTRRSVLPESSKRELCATTCLSSLEGLERPLDRSLYAHVSCPAAFEGARCDRWSSSRSSFHIAPFELSTPDRVAFFSLLTIAVSFQLATTASSPRSSVA